MPRKILVVDDNPINRQMLINTLCNDYSILEAENGVEALSLMHRHYKMLSAVLLDIVMPEMDGYDVLRHIRDSALLAQIPVIMVTGSEDEDSKVKGLSLGANDYILKPFNPDIVKHCLRNNIALRETASILNAIQKDKLTGLYNRETFFDKANSMISEKEPGTYILSCFDIDNFKLINDQYGAVEGDRILKETGAAVKSGMEEIGGLAGRISADNFAALFPADKKEKGILQKVREGKLAMIDQRTMVFSVGRYLITDRSLPSSALYDRAYLAKQSVKGRYDKHVAYFDETMLQKLIRDQQIVSDMENALAEHQFQAWFQPQYNHVTGALIGAEALVRWHHPQKGIIPPGEFVPLFEQNGFVYELDKYVWRESCRYLRKWLDAGFLPPPVSVNISRYDIFRADLIDIITGLVNEFDIPINMLRLEVTESAFAKSTQLIVDIVKQLIALGFTIEIDDFGSGYSSLNTLKSVPAQVVKLDMHFLDSSDNTRRGGNILESIVRMTKWLGMSVIAEGVETKEQCDFLKSIGCSHVQGFLYSQPMPAWEFESYFRNALRDDRLPTLETVENLNNDVFWDPSSIDSLIFNSYVGSACICEYCGGKLDILRATDKYARMLGGPNMTVEELLKLDLMRYLDTTYVSETFARLEAVIESKGEIIGEFLFLDLPGCPHETYTRSTIRVIASAGDSCLLYCISENITAQRISERKERSTAKRLQAIMDNINCGITASVITNGKKTRFLLANDTYYDLLGYTREQYRQKIGNNSFSTILPDDAERVRRIAENTIATGIPASMEYRVLRHDGKVIWLRSFLSMTSFEDVSGQVQLCTYADITAEKYTAQNLLDNLPCGAGICEVTGTQARMTYLNKRYLTYFNHSAGEQSEVSVFSVIHPDDEIKLRIAMRPALEKGGEGTCVIRIMDEPGKYIPFRISGVAMQSDSGIVSLYVIFVPISHEELSISEILPVALENMMASSTDLSFVKDRDLKYVCCSRAFAKMVGLNSEKDIVGKTDIDLFSAKLSDAYTADDRDLIRNCRPMIDHEESLPSSDGKSRYSTTSKYPLFDSVGNVVGLYGVGHDITLSREAEKQQKFLINNIPGGVAIYEGKWTNLKSIKLTYFSDGFCRLFGYTRQEYEKLGEQNPTGLIAKEYLPGFVAQIDALVKNGTPIDYIYRALSKDGAYRWIHVKAVMGERHDENMTVNAVLFDVTEHQEALERLRVSEEENRLALQHSENIVCRYDVAERSLKMPSGISPAYDIPLKMENVPYEEIAQGRISPETAKIYIDFYEDILHGKKDGSAVYQRKTTAGWRWIKAQSSTIFSSSGEPVSAVISFRDVTESFEKDAAYKKWRQSICNKEESSYSLFRCSVSKKAVLDTVEGSLLYISFRPGPFDFDEHTREYVEKCVYYEDAARFRAFLSVESLLEKYYRGERAVMLEYRERLPHKDYRWLRLTADLVEYPHSTDVEAYLLFENIDDVKRAELLTIERAETDPLTGVYNRTTFAEKVDDIIRSSEADAVHALLMLDIDGFKQVNDAFGHAAGDQALIEMAELLRRLMRRCDIVGRLGGDEFVVFMNGIPNDSIAAKKAAQICQLSRKTYSAGVDISVSVGIAVCPRDATHFEELYKMADKTLYHVKSLGRDDFGFYSENMADPVSTPKPQASQPAVSHIMEKKRRMLIVDDNTLDNELLANIFREDFNIEKANDGNAALIRMRHYGSSISVVLLDLMMPGMSGFEVLKKMRQTPELSSIPVVVVSVADDRNTSLRAIREGASDFVMKPVDPDILRIRVLSAISKAENERLRAKNSCLELQSAETLRNKAVLDKIGLAVAELDWGKSSFIYSPSLSQYLYGKYDGRSLWHILMTDLAADTETVKNMQQLVHDVADNRDRTEGSIRVRLKIPSGKLHWFSINVYKLINEYGLTDKIILTFKDTEAQK